MKSILIIRLNVINVRVYSNRSKIYAYITKSARFRERAIATLNNSYDDSEQSESTSENLYHKDFNE